MHVKRFIEIEHTGDLAFLVPGRDLKELFENAGFALYSQVIHIETVDKQESFPVSAEAGDRDELLINWLNELNFLSQTKQYVFCSFNILSMDDKNLQAEVWGQKYDSSRHGPFQEIKAVTFHNNEIKKTADGYECLIICDI